MRGPRVFVLGLMLLAMMGVLGVVVSVFQSRAEQFRAQRLVSLIESAAGPRSWSAGGVVTPSATIDAAVARKVEALLKSGGTPNAWGRTSQSYADEQEMTPLMVAAVRGLPLTTRTLLRHGADPNVSNRRGRTALMCAGQGGSPEVLQLLLDAGADVNRVDHTQRTALNYVWDYGGPGERRMALLRPLKWALAKPGPISPRREEPGRRFIPSPLGTASLTSQWAYNPDRMPASDHFFLPDKNGAPVLDRHQYDQLAVGMPYRDVARIIGPDQVSAEMLPDYRGTVTFTQGRREIALEFRNGVVCAKRCSGL